MKKITTTSDDQSLVMVESASRFITKIRRRCTSFFSRCISHLKKEDRISDLPDDILVSILSLMFTGSEIEDREIDQVVRTSVLSRRWRSLWKYALTKSLLAFTFTDIYDSNQYMKFVNRVNLILSLLCDDTTIDGFNLSLWLYRDHGGRSESDLHGWIDSVLQKRVKRLNIDIDFRFGERFELNRQVIRNHNMDSLVSLSLVRVKVTGEFLEYLLTICGSLQHLSVSNSSSLVDLTVSGPWLKLKALKILFCWQLEHLYIRDVNLVSLEYAAASVSTSTVVVENTPHLVNAHIHDNEKSRKVLSYLPQLQTLVLEFCVGRVKSRPALEFPKLRNLAQLELLLRLGTRPNYRHECVKAVEIVASLLASYPSLRGLKLVFRYLEDTDDEDGVERLEHRHECLKVVEIVGFIGCKLDTGVALYIIENTASLEKIVVDTTHSFAIEEEEKKRARASAKEQLGTRLLHTGTKFVFK